MQNKLLDQKNLGFTIIEVMIVLAIAGLILAIVFIAVPQLQRNSRDNQRRSIVGRVKAELDEYASNHAGLYPFVGATVGSDTPAGWTNCTVEASVPGNCRSWYDTYLGGGNVNINDPSSGNPVNVWYSTHTANPGGPITPGDLWVGVGAKCSNGSMVAGDSPGTYTSKQYAVVAGLDRAGTWFCVDNG